MHDRRIDGKVQTFGNQGVLFMNAMTWWDHETKSIWSQPWGTAIAGERKGTALTLLPFSLMPWSAWLAQHPDTTVVVDERGKSFLPDLIPYDFVIGVSIKEQASAFYMNTLKQTLVTNDFVGEQPIVVSVNPETSDVRVYLRETTGMPADESVAVPERLTFEFGGPDRLRDLETGSVWETTKGIAIEGPLRGTPLQQVPFITSFDWAWEDFFPESRFWGESGLGDPTDFPELKN